MKFALALIFCASPAWAMTEFELTCEACHYHTILPDGPTKVQSKRKMRFPKIFFCPEKKTFISVLDAKKTKNRVKPQSKYLEFRSRSCKGPAIPLEFYKESKEPCPICGNGELKIAALKFID